MSYEKVSKLIDLLYEKTKSSKITWEESEKDNVYQMSFPKYSVRMFIRENQQDFTSQDYFIQIINENGTVIDEVSDLDVKDIIDGSYKKMEEMYNLARRQALGVDEALDIILNNLNDEEDFPF